ncbi:PilZ domain-containing protein [Ectothiorhodospira lacustris]|uniref:PilZ domain-containing protein n=1 Tax=Ectothiorhodospira lacustris TaxID=2899127 RepID=UPI001EE8F6F8|nr:PilZ domain-containing protein [Ectothiorhodospira lacustris]MCG5500714.1 PilZ domain-containing protein [Ectothiorhodospira lacustris]MCG5509067.1 PilZ domain-containing protein [Ectothiorhodospira lacustris]MCG5520858.1 PilZ domain-containing protein [Ectothiorhodospira lacustris]
MSSDQRRHPRVPMEITVELHCEDEAPRRVQTIDLSGGGVMLLIPEGTIPDEGTEVKVRVCGQLGDGEAPPLVNARVVRRLPEGVAVEFLP